VNPFRDPRWGRGQEVPGEDPLHISQYARALIPAIQGTDPLHLDLVATCKHYLGYDMENWGGHERYGYDAKITTQDLVEYYLPTFKACVRDAKGASLMVGEAASFLATGALTEA
jgi:beta-D-xylosidase 4